MTVYVPILKGRRPQFQALRHVTDQDDTRPVVEVEPGERDADVKVSVTRLAGEVGRNIPDGVALAFDTAPLARRFGRSAPREALSVLATLLEDRGHAFRPVIRPDDDPGGLGDVRRLVADHQMGVCLRVDGAYACGLGDVRPLLEQLDAVGVAPERADVVVDRGYLPPGSDAVTGVAGTVELLLGVPWQSVVVAAGSFPAPGDLRALPPRRVCTIGRREARLWREARRRWPVGVGDYGVDHPGPPPEGRPFGPNLRYTTGDTWRLYQWPTDASGGYSTFYDLCRTLRESADWPRDGPAFSWGDRRIELAALGRAGPGGGAQWKAYSVSHHLASIRRHLDDEEAFTAPTDQDI
ncbi:hypothetical protein GCM10009677_03640 [Sphaerisporangium rubeum]|uniref:Beta protein n=1 Tax=Sphaerisporangium rubeum TaxID=321317 RepID=A0A7X0M460_9ACTN|nr:beta family protein [Sphaerisporangium rubeum]MBB6470792.1 hypothetical protein [Sphaerisporangium rubeum]